MTLGSLRGQHVASSQDIPFCSAAPMPIALCDLYHASVRSTEKTHFVSNAEVSLVITFKGFPLYPLLFAIRPQKHISRCAAFTPRAHRPLSCPLWGRGSRSGRLFPVFAQLPPLARGSPHSGRTAHKAPAAAGPPPWPAPAAQPRGTPRHRPRKRESRGAAGHDTTPHLIAAPARFPHGDTRGSSPPRRRPPGPGSLRRCRRWQVRRAAAAGGEKGGATQPQRAGAAAACAAARGGAAAGPAPTGPAPQRGRRRQRRGSLTCRGGAEDSHDGHPPGRGLSEVGLAGVQAGQRAAHVVVGSHDPH